MFSSILKCLLTILASGLFFTAKAVPHVRLNETVWGCSNPSIAAIINNNKHHQRSDPLWLEHMSEMGECRPLSPHGIWEPLTADRNGFTYLTSRSETAEPGSFWVPTSALVFLPSASVPAKIQPRKPSAEPDSSVAVTSLPPLDSSPSAVKDIKPPSSVMTDRRTQATVPPPSSDDGSAWNWLIFGGIVFALCSGIRGAFVRRRERRAMKMARVAQRKMTLKPLAIQNQSLQIRTVPLRETTSEAIKKNSGKNPVWHGPNAQVRVKGRWLPEGMVYVGAKIGGYGIYNSCVIDPTLSVSSERPEELGYWPSYARISPECRNHYLNWLASGRKDPDVNIGYVFLFFYGLERRLLIDQPHPAEISLLLNELHRLRSLYGSNRSFDGYSRRLIEAVAFLYGSGHETYVPDLFALSGDMPLMLRLSIGRQVLAGHPLSFELSTAALFGFRDFWQTHRHVFERARREFLHVFRARFDKTYPSGYQLQNRKSGNFHLNYHGAMAGLTLTLSLGPDTLSLPDLERLDWTALKNLACSVAEELAPYVKIISHQPERAHSLAAAVSCPPELRNNIAVESQRWLQNLTSLTGVPFGELAGHVIGLSQAKWTLRHRIQVSETLSLFGFAMEPSLDHNTETLENGTIVQVFRCTDNDKTRSLDVASAASMLIAKFLPSEQEERTSIINEWAEQACSELGLGSEQAIRLRAKIAWYRTNPSNLTKIQRLLKEATYTEREFCANSAAMAAIRSGLTDKGTISLLEKFYDRLEVARSSLYSILHSGFGELSPASDEPIEVAHAAPEILHPIPIRPKTKAPPSDTENLARLRAETQRVSALLDAVFTEDEPEVPTFPEEEETNDPFNALDAAHGVLVTTLLKQSEWQREAFDSVAKQSGLMPDGAMETINEWAFDYFGDALLEGDRNITVNVQLLKRENIETVE